MASRVGDEGEFHGLNSLLPNLRPVFESLEEYANIKVI